MATIAVANRHVLVSCPELAEVHSMMSWWDNQIGQVKERHLLAETRSFWSVHVEAGTLPIQQSVWVSLTPTFPAGERRVVCQAG